MVCLLRNTAYVDGSEQEQSRHGRLGNGSWSENSGFGCRSFTSEAAADAWAAEQLRNDPGAVVIVWKAFSADIHRIYEA